MDSDSKNISANHSKWAKRSLWTLVQAANLYIDIEPFNLSPIPEKHLRRIADPARREKWNELYTKLKLATKKGDLKSWPPTQLQLANGKTLSPLGGTHVEPRQCIEWAQGVGFEFPSALVAALNPNAQAGSNAADSKTTTASGLRHSNIKASTEEIILNGKLIEWQHWMELPLLTAAQAARLMNALDPRIFCNLDTSPNTNDSTEAREKARAMELLANREGKVSATAREWLDWAIGRKLEAHSRFCSAVDELSKAAPAESKPQIDANVHSYKLSTTTHNLNKRRDILDPIIDKAIQSAGSSESAAVFLKLKELALNNEAPFTGLIDGDALLYTNSQNEPDSFSKRALAARLSRRRNAKLR